jgi:serine protease Do/serine protease DegQ
MRGDAERLSSTMRIARTGGNPVRLAVFALAASLVVVAPPAIAQPISADARGLPTLAPMLEKVTPAVVNIAVLVRTPEENPLLRDPFFRRFFDLPDRPVRPQVSAGSGVIVDAGRGLVITNHHVVKDAQEVVVTLKDRRALPAQIVGSDSGTDIALLRVKHDNLVALRLGDSDALQVGDFVVAIGNPFGIGQTVTSGIVSALGRSGLSMEGYEDFIQTDASINPGNSGGALVNLRGDLVGINSAIIGPSGGNVGIGFAVPINMARAVMDQILRFGEVRRGRLGVGTEDLTPHLAQSMGLPSAEGAVVGTVEKDSPADKAGLKVRDVVVAMNGRPVRGSIDLRNRVGLVPIGEEVELRVLRAGKPVVIRARVAEPFAVSTTVGEVVPQLEGARVANIEQGMPMYGRVEGVLVTAVEPNTAAARNGLRKNDVLVAVNRRRVRSLAELVVAVRGAEPPLRLSLLRGESLLTLVLR